MNPETTDPGSTVPFRHHGCAGCLDDLVHLALGELPAEKVAAIDAHCATCASCRAERELLAKSAALVAADAPKLAPLLALSEARQQALRQAAAANASVAAGVASGGDRAAAVIRPFWTVRRLAAAAAAVVAVALGGQWIWRGYDLGGRGKASGPQEALAEVAWHDRSLDPARSTAADAGGVNGPAPSSSEAHRGALNLRRLSSEALVDQLSAATDARDADAARAAIVALAKEQVTLDPARIASLSVDLAQAEQPELALELLRQAPKADSLDDASREKLRRVNRFVEGKLPDAAKDAGIEQLRALGYLSDDADEAEVADLAAEDEAALARLGFRASDGSATIPVPPVGGLAQSQSILFDDSGAETSWRVFDPSAPTDAFGVDLDLMAGGENVTGVALATATSPSTGPIDLKHVMLAPDNLTVDSLGKSPELNAPLSILGSLSGTVTVTGTPGQGAVFAPSMVGYDLLDTTSATTQAGTVNAADFTYPGTTYDFPDVAASTAAALDDLGGVHALSRMSGSDTGVWIAADSDGAAESSRGVIADPRMQQIALAAFLANLSIVAPSDLVAFEGALGRAAAKGATVDVDAVVKSFLAKLAPQQGEAPRDMFFRWFGDNAVIPTRLDSRSTFGMDVDSASYNLARAYLAKGTLPPKAAVRTEEFVNAFKQGLEAPSRVAAIERGADGIVTTSTDDVFALTTELAPSPFGEGKHMLRVGLKAREIDRAARKPTALTFVIDVSGSMNEGGRLELVKQALRLLVAQLDERDSVGIVVFSEHARIALPPTRGCDRERILAALDPLRPEQSTNAGAGLRLGYDLAIAALSPDADNRVVMCSDGVANSGVTDPDQLTARIRECKGKRIALTTVGVGMNNVNDALLEQLAREGDGNCHYVDGLPEAKELFVDKLTGTLSTVARDAKIQVEFEPGTVVAFRQLGYENRALAHQDFRNDKVDAGEVGAGHEVVALYEVDLAPDAAGPLATVRCRYEDPRTASVREQARICFAAEAARSAGEMGPRWRLAAAVAEFAELLRQSVHARDGSLSGVLRLAEPLVAELPDDNDVPEFVALVQQAARLPDLLPPRTAIVRCVDELKRTRCLEQELRRLDPPQQAANDTLLRQLEEQNQKLERALRDAITQAATKR